VGINMTAKLFPIQSKLIGPSPAMYCYGISNIYTRRTRPRPATTRMSPATPHQTMGTKFNKTILVCPPPRHSTIQSLLPISPKTASSQIAY
jgi:hypothetical protein